MLTLDDGLRCVAPGGLFDPATRTLVIADVHAGYVRALQGRGYLLPGVDDGELFARIADLRARLDPTTVVIAGDVVHGPAALRAAREGGASALDGLLAALDGCDAVVVPGNHDRGLEAALDGRAVTVCARWEFGPHVAVHGDDLDALRGERALALRRGGRVVLGHHHPALVLRDASGARTKVMAFAWAPGIVCLPALTPFARGGDLVLDDDAKGLTAAVPAGELETAVIVGARVLPTGRLDRVRAVQGRRPARRRQAG
jgi:metallophosphoesterase superfamily enzyme